MANVRPDWAWQPDAVTQKAILSGNNKVRRAASRGSTSTTEETMVMATKTKKAKKTAAKKGAPKRKLDGKALAAQRKPRDSVAQFIKDELEAGRTDVDRIIEKAKDNFPKAKPTRGYVRFIAKQIGKYKQVEPEGGAPAKAAKPAKAKKASKKKAAAKTESKSESKDETPAVDPAS